MATLAEALLDIVNRLPDEQQRRVLDYARALEAHPSPPLTPPGKPAGDFLAFRPTISVETADEMGLAIEEACETIEPDEDVSL
jgi:hypothetical protein